MKEKSKEEDMKAPSIEEKAKAYDEALSVAQETYTTQPMYRDWLAKMFPELKESKDEKIRKEIINFIKISKPEWENYSDYSSWIAWLEKQCKTSPILSNSSNIGKVEQKPADTWKPSEEQMIALRQAISGCSYDVEPLLELEKQLKKL